MNCNALFDGVAKGIARNCDALLAVFDRSSSANIDYCVRDFSGREFDLFARGACDLKPLFGIHLDIHCLSLLEIVAQHDGKRNLVALRKHARRIMRDGERLRVLSNADFDFGAFAIDRSFRGCPVDW